MDDSEIEKTLVQPCCATTRAHVKVANNVRPQCLGRPAPKAANTAKWAGPPPRVEAE